MSIPARLLCFLSLTLLLLVGAGREASAASVSANKVTIFQYLTETMGLNPASACGIMANIERESDFDPHCKSASGQTYGICQWQKSRFQSLKNYCSKKELDYTTLEAQLAFLNHECHTSTYKYILTYLKKLPNTAEGAYDAGSYWCTYYERPANVKTAAKKRGELAQNTYWPVYGAGITPPILSGASSPIRLSEGDTFAMAGTVSSETKLKNVSVSISTYSGEVKAGATVSPGSSSYDLAELQDKVQWSSLPAGVYRYQITATNVGTTEVLLEKVFSVNSTRGVCRDGNIRIAALSNSSLSLRGKAESSTLKLMKSTTSSLCDFQIVAVKQGWYAIRSLTNGLYVTAGSSGKVSLKEWMEKDSQYWQILPVSDGVYCLEPKSEEGVCLSVDGTRAAGAAMKTSKVTLGKSQIWKFCSVSNDTAVKKPKKKVSLTVSKTSYSRTYGSDAFRLKVTSEGTVTYKSSDPSVAKVSKGGNVLPKGYGTALITVTATKKGYEKRSETVTVKVRPEQMTLKSVRSPSSGTVRVAWVGDSTVTGYILQISPRKNFSGKSTKVTIRDPSISSCTVRELKNGRNYYVRIRSYSSANETKSKGTWSEVRSVEVK